MQMLSIIVVVVVVIIIIIIICHGSFGHGYACFFV
jgi:hypothetical protein